MKAELNEQDIAELSGRLDAMVRLGGLAAAEHALRCVAMIEAAIVRAQTPPEVAVPGDPVAGEDIIANAAETTGNLPIG